MSDYKLMPVEPTQEMLDRAMGIVTGFSGPYGECNDYLDEETAREVYEAFRTVAPVVQGEPVTAQQRFRHPQVTPQDWSTWQPAAVSLDRPSWEIDSQGYEVEYRLLYVTPQPVEQQNSDVDGFKLIPDLPHGFNHSAYNRHTGEWVYLNHANTWQLFQGPSHESQQSVMCGYLINDGFKEHFVKTLTEGSKKIAQRFNWKVTAVCRCPDYESGQGEEV